MWFDLNFPSEQRHVEVLAKIVSVYTYAGQGEFIIDCASTSTMGNGLRMYRLLGHTLHGGRLWGSSNWNLVTRVPDRPPEQS